MTSTGSVTHWIGRLKAGDPSAAQKLWEAYFQRLVRLARGRLRTAPRRAITPATGPRVDIDARPARMRSLPFVLVR